MMLFLLIIVWGRDGVSVVKAIEAALKGKEGWSECGENN
jgi:hypothetical protein